MGELGLRHRYLFLMAQCIAQRVETADVVTGPPSLLLRWEQVHSAADFQGRCPRASDSPRRSSLTAPEPPLCSACSSSPPQLSPGDHRCFCRLHRFAFSGTSYCRSHAVCSLFPSASSLSKGYASQLPPCLFVAQYQLVSFQHPIALHCLPGPQLI